MNFYNMNSSLGLAKDINIDKQKYGSTNLFILHDNLDELFNNFLFPNIQRKLGSYIIFDFNNYLYNKCREKLDNDTYKIENYDIATSYDLFHNMSSEEDAEFLAEAIIENTLDIKNSLKTFEKRDSLFSSRAKITLSLIVLYMINKVPSEKRSLLYLRKIVAKLYNSPDIEYFKKIFANIDATLKMYDSLYLLKHVENDAFKNILTILAKTLNNIPKELYSIETKHRDFDCFKGTSALTLQFVQVTDGLAINSLFCNEMLKNLKASQIDKAAIPLLINWTFVDKIGYINLLDSTTRSSTLRNIIYILGIQNVKNFILLYGAHSSSMMKQIEYGILFPTQIENNTLNLKKILAIPNVDTLVDEIAINPNYCVIYRSNLQTSKELRLTESDEAQPEKKSSDQLLNSSSYTEEIDDEMDSLNTKDEIISKLKEDLDKEQNPIYRKHFTELYNTFYSL